MDYLMIMHGVKKEDHLFMALVASILQNAAGVKQGCGITDDIMTVAEKEKMLKEQAQALQVKQQELAILQQNIESRNANADNGQIDTILIALQEQISALSSLPFQIENLNQRVAQLSTSNADLPPTQQTTYDHIPMTLIISAIQLSKTLEAENARKRITSSYKPNTSPRADFTKPPQPINQTPSNNPQQVLPRTSATPFIKPLIPGIPGPNFPAWKICRYCKAPRHLIDECRKLAYRRSVENNPSQSSTNNVQSNPGNAQSVPLKYNVIDRSSSEFTNTPKDGQDKLPPPPENTSTGSTLSIPDPHKPRGLESVAKISTSISSAEGATSLPEVLLRPAILIPLRCYSDRISISNFVTISDNS
ncbi:hypothetical protein EAG_09273 [Camponotus floridanus]|uniref:Uncharacterized protein n=1 Tax=Camponotus floridanus TaxID=104421 RepID=E2B0A6_CAMFO|nr:hypothetical protein EAG_09273 [Camponotus floridanus]